MTLITPKLRALALLALCLLLAAASSCKPGTLPGTNPAAPAAPTDPHARLKGPGIEFRRTSVGMPETTLDFIGTTSGALAAAKQGQKIYFGQSDKDVLELYVRDLKQDTREFVTELKPYLSGTLATTPDGKYLTYCRMRPLSEVLDDPKVTFPKDIAVPYRFNVERKSEERLFDFGLADFRRWRTSATQPFISPDGHSVYVLSYDVDRLLLHKQTEEWLGREAHLRAHDKFQKPEDRKSEQELVDKFPASAQMRQLLVQAGVTVDEAHPVTDAVRKAMQKFFDDTTLPQMALLSWHDGKASVLPFQPEEQYKLYNHLIAAVGNHSVVIGAQSLDTTKYSPEPIFTIDEKSGKLTQVDNLSGLTKLVVLDEDEKNLLICYNPVQIAAGQQPNLLNETFVRRIPLDGQKPTETSLKSDYLGGIVDMDDKGTFLIGQDFVDHKLYLVDTTTAKRELVSAQIDELSAIVMTGDAQRVVYVVNGATFEIDMSKLADHKGWITEEHFVPFRTACAGFLDKLGFTVPTGLVWNWAEHEGLGTHDVSVQLTKADVNDKGVLLRYDATAKQVTSVWLPGGYLLPIAPELQGKNYDYYDAEKFAKTLLDRTGWMPADKRTLYQPGPNPVYDKKSDSYVITFRSGYPLPGAESQIVFNREVTQRIGAKNGELAEMSLLASPEVTNQPLKIQRKDLDFIARNYKKQPIAQSMPIKVDSAGARLVIHQVNKQGMDGAVYKGTLEYRMCWEVDLIGDPDKNLYFTYLIDTETGDIIGDLSYAAAAPGTALK